MNAEQNLIIIKERDLFIDVHGVLERKIMQELVNMHAGIIRSTADEIVQAELWSVPLYVNAPFIARYNIVVKFISKDGDRYSKRARLSVKHGDGDSGISFEKELL